MSLLPHAFDSFHPVCNRPGCHPSPFDWWFKPSDFPALRSGFGNHASFLRPKFPESNNLEQEAKIGKDGFNVCLDVQHFQPNEITVKTANNTVVVHAEHEQKQDEHGYISREFTRRYDLPEGFRMEDVVSTLSSDGILTIKAPHSTAIEDNVRHVQVQQTGPARLNIASNEEKTDEQK